MVDLNITLWIQLANFLVTLVVLNYLLISPIRKIIRKRKDNVEGLLGVMDDIDRALVAMSQTDDIESVRKGIELIHQKLLDTLHGKGVQEIEAVGNEFDTDLHEAVAKLPVEDDKKGKIIDVVQKGYKLKDKVVRYAKVVVGE